jgi:predicted dehydrogenase
MMERRDFLRATLAAVPAAGLSAVGLADQTPSPRRRLRLGFLGVSHSHAAEKIEVVQTSTDWDLIGFCEENRELRAKYAQAGLVPLSAEELLRRSQVVAVESGVRDHACHAKAALSAGKHVHLEKPPAQTLDAFRDLVTLARQKNLLLQMGYMWRYHPGINAALEAARKGWLGEVYLVRGTINTQLSAERRLQWAPLPGGTLFELGSHLIDVLVRLMGRPARGTSLLRTDGHFSDKLADNTIAIFEFARAVGIVSSSALQPNAGPHRSLEIFGSNGSAVVNPIEPPVLAIDLEKSAGPYRAGVNNLPMPTYRRHVADFADLAARICEGRKLAVSPDEDLLIQETLIQACASRKSRGQ